MSQELNQDFLDDIVYPEVKTFPVDEEKTKLMANVTVFCDLVDNNRIDDAMNILENVASIPEIDEENY